MTAPSVSVRLVYEWGSVSTKGRAWRVLATNDRSGNPARWTLWRDGFDGCPTEPVASVVLCATDAEAMRLLADVVERDYPGEGSRPIVRQLRHAVDLAPADHPWFDARGGAV